MTFCQSMEDLEVFPFFIRWLLIAIIVFCIYVVSIMAIEKSLSIHCPRIISKLFNHKKLFLILSFLFVVCWIPYFIAFAPGTLNVDTTGQLVIFYSWANNDGFRTLADHHPIFDTMVIGAVVYLFDAVFGGIKYGIMACVFLQLCVTAMAFSYAVCSVKRWGAPNIVLFVGALFFMIFPLIPITVCSLSKDTFFRGSG